MYPTFAKAQEAKIELVARIQAIESQLSERGAVYYETQAEYREFKSWKAKACYAKAKLINELQRTKLWMQANRESDQLLLCAACHTPLQAVTQAEVQVQ